MAVSIWLSNTSSHWVLREHTQPEGLLLNWMPQLKMYKQYAYQRSHPYLHHILKEPELNQDVKKILREWEQLKAIPARWLLIQFLRMIPKYSLSFKMIKQYFMRENGNTRPLANTLPLAQPLVTTWPLAQPMAKTLSLARPLAKTWPLAQLLPTTLPLAWPLAKTWPSASSWPLAATWPLASSALAYMPWRLFDS